MGWGIVIWWYASVYASLPEPMPPPPPSQGEVGASEQPFLW